MGGGSITSNVFFKNIYLIKSFTREKAKAITCADHEGGGGEIGYIIYRVF